VDRFRPDASSRDWLLKELGIPPQSVLIGMVARYDPMKDHAGFLQAAARMAGMLPSVHFVLVGKGVQDDNPGITCMLDEESLKGRVHLLGLRQDIPRIMAGLDIAVSSSAFGEGFSNTIGEAMCCGVPCIVTDVGDSGRIVGETGIVVRPRDPEALAGAMLRLVMSGREARKSLGEKARERILRNFELTSVVNRFEA
ncbi:MAG: glycosyltransferase, partial [Deltaproteobacteria bacterium]|nr:glycosyltransferase [Deltaproteobacteria bacterium]